MTFVTILQHPTWGRISNRDGDEWELEEEADWPGVGSIAVRFCFDDPDHSQTRSNYLAMKARWADLWPRILRRTEEMRASYSCQEEKIDVGSDYLYVRPPVESLERSPRWSVMLQSISGWLLDFEGWADAGGQGVLWSS